MSASSALTVDIAPYPFMVSLVAEPGSVTEPNQFTLKATSNGVGAAGFVVKIIDEDRNQTLKTCSPGGTCTYAVNPGWDPHNQPGPRHYRAEIVSQDGTTVAAQQRITVDVRPYPFELSLVADPESVTEPEMFTLTATSNGASAPYTVNIIDEDSNQTVKVCSPGGTCRATISYGLHPHNAPSPRHYRAEIVSRDGAMVVALQRLTVDIAPYPFQVSLAAAKVPDATPLRFTLTATSNGANTLFPVKIIDEQSNLPLTSCNAGGSCTTNFSPPADGSPRAFHAEIRSRDGQKVVARSGQILIIGDQIVEGEDIDLAQLVGLFTSVEQLCLTLAAMPEAPHTNPSSVNDPAWICLSEQAAGRTMAQVLATVLARGGAAAVAGWLIFVATPQDVADGTPPWYPPPHPPDDPPYNPTPPTTLPGAWDAPIAAAAERIRALNPTLALDATALKDIAKRCAWLAAQARRPLSECGQPRLPIFVTGGNVMDVTKHDLRAIGSRPASWMKLNYDGVEKSRDWLLNDPRCKDLTGEGTGMQCHEYPYNKTEQGGQSGSPSIEPMPSGQNMSQGGSFGVGVTRCAMRPALSSAVRGDAFLVVPVPVEGIPTTMLCNGKSASSQPQQAPAPGG